LRFKRAIDNQFIWHLLRASPQIDEEGKVKRWMLIATDVNDLKNVQSMFQLVMDNIPISIFWKDRDSHYLGCNRSFAADVGRANTEALIGKNDYDNPSTKKEADFFRACDKRVMDSGKAEYHIIEPQLRADGKTAWLDTSKMPLHDAGGEVIGVLGLYEDITRRVLAEQQRQDFISTLTHDLRNPLLGTNRVLDLFIKNKFGELDGNQIEILEQVKKSNHVLIGMIENLNEVYRFDNLTYTPTFETVKVSSILNELFLTNEIVAKAKAVKLTLSLPETVVEADTSVEAFRRIVQNLLDNSLKFTPPNGQINLSMQAVGEKVEISIQDNGPGIEEEAQQHLFDRFWQGLPGKKYTQGTGLGLYLCKKIVEAHRGDIRCQSQPGQSTVFTFAIPLKQQSANR